MKFSFIIPIYNVASFLDRCLISVVNQSYENLEIILVNDGSTDNSEEICLKYVNSDSRIKYLKKKNGGLSDARNAGIEIATGDYLIFVDSDDFISVDLCAIVKDVILKHDPDILQYNFKKFIDGTPEDDFITDDKLACCVKVYESDSLYYNYLITENIKREAWSKVYKRTLFQNIKYPVGRIAEDLATTYQLVNKSQRIVCISNELYFYRMRANSIMSSGSIKLFYDAMLAHFEIYLDSINKGVVFEKHAYTNYFNNLLKLISKNNIEICDYKTDDIIKRYSEIKFSKLNMKGRILFIASKLYFSGVIKFVYNKYVSKKK